VEVVIHQAISVTAPFVASAHLAKNVEPVAAVSVIGVDVFATVSTRRDVIDRTGEFNA
jgi:hypothetical protein